MCISVEQINAFIPLLFYPETMSTFVPRIGPRVFVREAIVNTDLFSVFALSRYVDFCVNVWGQRDDRYFSVLKRVCSKDLCK